MDATGVENVLNWREMRRDKIRVICGAVLVLLGITAWDMGVAQAAASYSNAREFYESTGEDGCHTAIYGGSIYYATQARLASSPYNLKYCTVGYDVSMTANGQTVEFGVRRVEDGSAESGSMREVPGSGVESGGYAYNLYSIPREELEQLAGFRNPQAAQALFDHSEVQVRIDAIMTTKQYGRVHGGVSEDGSGGLTEWGKVYHLKNGYDLVEMRKIFPGHTFAGFHGIARTLENYALTVRYKLDGGVPEEKGFRVKEDILTDGNGPVLTSSRLMNGIMFLNQQSIRLVKKGYHIEPGKEWFGQGRTFDQAQTYWTGEVYPDVTRQDGELCVTANWKPNTYTVRYEANGGSGSLPSEKISFGENVRLQGGFSKKGYIFDGYMVSRTTKEGEKSILCGETWQPWEQYENRPKSWKIYHPGENFIIQESYISGSETDRFTFYAQWKENMIKITTDKRGGSGGTEVFYEKYQLGWYENKTGKTEIDTVVIPVKSGYHFMGYYSSVKGMGKQIADRTGKLAKKDAGYFVKDSKVYADWEPEKYTIVLDKQGGSGGLTGDAGCDKAHVYYQGSLPKVLAPVRKGFEFRGYFTEKNGKGTLYYNDCMRPERTYQVTKNITLYAYWIDTREPQAVLKVSPSGWTNRKEGVTLTVEAKDDGSGLSSMELYEDKKKVSQKTDLKGKESDTLIHHGKTEGAVPWKAVVTDIAGNQSETRGVDFYDITAPKGKILEGMETHSGTVLQIELFVTDYRVK